MHQGRESKTLIQRLGDQIKVFGQLFKDESQKELEDLEDSFDGM